MTYIIITFIILVITIIILIVLNYYCVIDIDKKKRWHKSIVIGDLFLTPVIRNYKISFALENILIYLP